MPITPVVRPATEADIPTLERIVAAAYRGYIARMGKPPGPMLDDYAAHVRDGHAWIQIADGEPSGVLVLKPEADHLLLDNIAVLPDRQGQGLGRLLLQFAEAEALRRGYRELQLYTNALMHENIALYRRSGWVEYARGHQDGYDRVFMRKRV